MFRMEVRCCCQPMKKLGSLPVSDVHRTQPGGSIKFPVMGDAKHRRGQIIFEIAKWAFIEAMPPELAAARPSTEAGPLVEVNYSAEEELRMVSGWALKHENVTLETLRRIPGFLEAS